MARKKPEEFKESAPLWMITFSDMNSLMMGFFVTLFSMATISPGKFQQVSYGFQTLMSSPPGILVGGKSMSQEPLITSNPGIRQSIIQIQANPEYKGMITIEQTNEGLLVELHNAAFFEPGSANLSSLAKDLLAKIGEIIIEHSTNPLWVYGYTSTEPLPKDSIYPSKWSLSAARAAAVVSFFLNDLKNQRANELVSEIMSGQFDPNYWYNPNRFVAIGRGDVPAQQAIESQTSSINQELQALRQEYAAGQISYEELVTKSKVLNDELNKMAQDINLSYNRVDILIRNQGD
ncbi:OmpA/MotB family protein [Athalassotoga saccharophila]|uniref:OmpA/MotB family protein n=1 Tax=Athalassotoga saccharophila TaxID=1441386 RepID=UPI00137B4101|nr:flagellar motor protein MotB [Athalassotoga saccharophila]BBJ27554.1 flagellar motor rotation protein MotB [Athalassotoga saccharophila]